MKESVLSFDEKTTQPWFSFFQIAGKLLFKTNPLNIIFDDFSIWLLGWRMSSFFYIFHKDIIS